MKIQTIKKRDGREVPYSLDKIVRAILSAMNAAGEGSIEDAERVAAAVEATLNSTFPFDPPTVENIQDLVENELIHREFALTAKAYIIYRANRTRARESNTSLMHTIDEITQVDALESDLKRDNANIDGNSSMGAMLQIGAAGAKAYNEAYLLKPVHAKAHREGYIHIHDFDFYALTTTCCQIDIIRLFKDGFSTGHGYLREPQSIQSYAALAAIAIQANQNDQHGGQSIPNFDYGMAPGIAKSFRKHFRKYLTMGVEDYLQYTEQRNVPEDVAGIVAGLLDDQEDIIRIGGPDIILDTKRQIFSFPAEISKALTAPLATAFSMADNTAEMMLEIAYKRAYVQTDKDTYQAMEGFVHNLNTMHSRAGAQTPFSSINYGTDVSPEGRMVIRNILLALDAGLGHGETCIFPIHIFKVKEGVNYNEGDPNYDLFRLSMKVSAKRLFPNYVFLDSPFNLQYYVPGRPETEVATMGCRTRVMANVHDPEKQISYSRGNLSFTSINLVRLALESEGNEEAFFYKLDEMLQLVAQQLLDRFEIQARKKVYNYPFLMAQGVWLDSDKLGPYDEVREVLKHGTLSIGFIGLAETLVALYGQHHGESKEMQEKGLKIIQHMRDFCDKKSAETHMNFTLLATPAEGLSGRFTRIDQKRFGKIPGVTDREYYTNSFHIPVYFPISAYEKIRLEAPYHALCNAGHISYVELDGDTTKNVEAFESIVRCMHDAGIGYGSINHPVDRDPVCGYVGVIGDVCPRCGRREGEAISPERMEHLAKQYPQIKSFIGIE